MSHTPIVRTVGLVRVYRSGREVVRALDGVDLTIAPGRFAAIMGRSGSGKTTLLNCIGAIDRPTAGEVYVAGQRLADLGERERTRLRRSRIGFVFQSFALLPAFSARENVELVLRLAGFAPRQRQERVQACLEMVGLAQHARQRPDQLSGGQQQRLAIARALATGPPLILADEPTGELDSITGRQILALFAALVQEQKTTVVMATHNAAVADYATDLYELRDGRLVTS